MICAAWTLSSIAVMLYWLPAPCLQRGSCQDGMCRAVSSGQLICYPRGQAMQMQAVLWGLPGVCTQLIQAGAQVMDAEATGTEC